MTTEKIYTFKGLDLRKSDLTTSPDQATDVRNVELDSRNNLNKRFGFDSLLAQPNTSIQLFENKKADEILYVHDAGIARLNAAQDAWEDINFGSVVTAWTALTETLDVEEYNGVNYFTDPSGKNELFKYDGAALYRAGIPKPVVSASTPGASYIRIFFQFIDGQGQRHFGDYVQVAYDPAGAITVNSVISTEDGLYSKYGIVSATTVISAGTLTLPVTAGHSYEAGDKLYVFDNILEEYRLILIDSAPATTLVFNAASVGTGTFNFAIGLGVEFGKWSLQYYVSTDPNFNFLSSKTAQVDPSVATVTTVPFLTFLTTMEEFYGDSTILKGMPPKCKYLTIYNNQLVLGNKIKPNDNSGDGANASEDAVYWNDLGVGSTLENFPPLNVEVMGKTTEGGISGLSSTQDTLVAFKQDQTYYLSGTLQNVSYRIRNSLGVKIGNVSHLSTVEYMGGHLFMSSQGIYFAVGGQTPVELSDKIEPLFKNKALDITGLDLTSAVGVLDRTKEKFYWYIPSSNEDDKIVVVYDFYHKEWFLHDNIKADGGFLVSDDVLYHSDGATLYKRNATYNDSNVAISAYYSSAWHDLGFPSLRKKFVNFVGLSTGGEVWTLGLTTQVDWDKATNITDQSVAFTAAVRVEDQKLDFTQKYANRFTLANSTLNQGMFLAGYEYEWEDSQKKPKGSS